MAAITKIVLQVDCKQEDMITTKRKQTIDDTFRMIDVYMYMHTDIVFLVRTSLEIFQEIICSHSCLNIFLYINACYL